MAQTTEDKNMKTLKLTPIEAKEDGTNNYSEFRQKSMLELDAHGYYEHCDGPKYDPPRIPTLIPTRKETGVDPTGNLVTITIRGNEDVVATAEQAAEGWSKVDKRVLAIIVRAVPSEKLYVVRDCVTAHEAWIALKNEYEPSNALTAVTIKQQIIGNVCRPGDDPVVWLDLMIQLYAKLRDADQNIMPDSEFASHLVTLMTEDSDWKYCRNELLTKLRNHASRNMPLSSKQVIERLKSEEISLKISPGMISINNLMAGRQRKFGKNTERGAVTGVYTAVPLEQRLTTAPGPSRTNNPRQDRRPAPYNARQRATRVMCENHFCESSRGHTKADCYAYGGGKQGQYPPTYKGKRDVHLAPAERLIARHKSRQMQEDAGNRFAGMAQYTNNTEEEVEDVLNGLAFMSFFPGDCGSRDDDDGDEVRIGEVVHVNAVALNTEVAKDGGVNHDTGASRHIFHDEQFFANYTKFDIPLAVHGFGSNLTAAAIGKGTVSMRARFDGETRLFSVSNALHIPSARCNLISGSRLDKKGVSTATGNGRITYFSPENFPFAGGSIVNDLYRMDVEPVVACDTKNSTSPQSDLMAAMLPSITSLFPEAKSAETSTQGFTIV
ncbi:hypothetical protein D9757_004186 [Collybiopsis confluens]|uniref:Retrovirus-related Pol polyprotein from transposon TNT 1-94-like beta-barrel domain-containing protein n=1 Tax=Collybiopsis confluens TaxID=2823264 RepID=A0A8H5HUC2_9AGAR|nr:hypothetical protein D9757_004126 [Collybiopsis confluens]KAF5389590.1 hypothetical protein D9757_004186 [Collybiopsis confluens]